MITCAGFPHFSPVNRLAEPSYARDMGKVKTAGKQQPPVKAVLDQIRQSADMVSGQELGRELLAAFGGTRKFAEHFVNEFNSIPKHGIARSRMLEAVVKIITQTSRGSGSLDLTEIGDDQIEELFADLMTRRAERGGAGESSVPDK